MFSKLVIVSLCVMALSINVEGTCDANACSSESQNFFRLLSQDDLTMQDVCPAAFAFIDCEKGVIEDCGIDSSSLDPAKMYFEQNGCNSAEKLFVFSPFLLLLLLLAKSVN
ncbi:uncharacterized protein LOC125373348 [Haliotis rufescens]|uniref:uncharacterized protein LOC125373348 n=1 Tax=Haliotis rufescens TaxID=6454 RepID=UPI00201F109E|nr:uncharacterized protein LOC125373348 [Haliotis rufescens]